MEVSINSKKHHYQKIKNKYSQENNSNILNLYHQIMGLLIMEYTLYNLAQYYLHKL